MNDHTSPADFTAELVERTVVVTWPNNERGGATPPAGGWTERAWGQPTLHEIDEGSVTGCSVLRWRNDPRADAELTAVSLALVSGGALPAAAAVRVPDTDHTTLGTLAEDLRYVLSYRGPGHAHERPGVWDTSREPCVHCARLVDARQNLAAYDASLAAVLPEPADRAAARCPSCEHEAQYHDADGRCWFTVEQGVPERDAVCSCLLRRLAAEPAAAGPDQTDETPVGGAQQPKTIRCDIAVMRRPHPAHDWTQRPDGPVRRCPGVAQAEEAGA